MIDHKKAKVDLHMRMAFTAAKESYCERKKVGAIVVTPDNGVVYGYNGMASGEPNVCELPDGSSDPLVYHAEFNAIAKLHDNRMDARGGTMFTTLSPCIDCAKLIERWGISRVYFADQYKNVDGLDYLYRRNVELFKVVPNYESWYHDHQTMTNKPVGEFLGYEVDLKWVNGKANSYQTV